MTELQKHARKINRKLAECYPDAECELRHETPFQLLVATILSAQCTDARVNEVTRTFFKDYPTPQALAEASLEEIEEAIRPTGFFRNKAKNIQACALAIVEEHGGKVPETMDELVRLGGVGRKTANVVLGNCFGVPGIVVDTHVKRLSNRMGLVTVDNPEKIETELATLIPAKDQVAFGHRMIQHGRRVCMARKPRCPECDLSKLCPKTGVA